VSHALRLERVIDASPEVVFDTFVDPGAQKDLYGDEPDWIVQSECDLRVGGRWTIVFGPPSGEPAREENLFEVVEKARRLVYSSRMTMPDGTVVHTSLDVRFEPHEGKTRLLIVQSGFTTTRERDEISSGWTSIIDGLERVARERAQG
jgi:uncharacterized protein YndB with AHSA1/START domain